MFAKRVRKPRRVVIEKLEERRLMTAAPWAPAAKLIGLDQAVAHYPQLTGKGEAVAVFDSGVDYRHPSLGGGFGSGKKVEAGWDFISGDADPMSDTFAHGTGAAGVIAADGYIYKNNYNRGIAPGVRIIALRQDSALGVKESLDWVLNNREKYNIVAVNMINFDGSSGAIYADVLRRLIAVGVFVSQPAGNGGPKAPLRAALDPSDFTVGSVSFSDQVSNFSQRGSGLDLVAPGEHVTIPYFDVKTRKSIYTDAADGTSWASPAVVGTAALIKQIDPAFTPAQIMQIMQESGKPVYDPVSKLTYKRLNVDAALALAYARHGGGTVASPLPVTAPPVVTPPETSPVTTPPVTAPPVTAPPVTPQAPESAPVVATTPQSPFSGKRIRIGSETTIQAETFDNGGEGVAYHDTEVANLGTVGTRGKAGVDLLKDRTGATYVGYTRAGEWLEYSVTVAKTGTYNINARVASLKAGGKFHVEVDGVDKTGAIAVPNTGSWENWSVVGKSGVSLTAGDHVVRLKMDSIGVSGGAGNFDWIRFSPMTVPSTPSTPTTTPNAFKPLFAIGADECLGSAALSSYLGYLDEGDVLAYHNINFGSSGATKFTANVAAAKGRGGKKIQVRLDSPTGKIAATLTVQETGSWTTFVAETTGMAKVTGMHDIFLTFAGGYGVANLDWFKFA
jgi:hypothetical protein